MRQGPIVMIPLLLSALACGGSSPPASGEAKDSRPPREDPSAQRIPEHRVAEKYEYEGDVHLYIVVDPRMTRMEAAKLCDHYREIYRHTPVFTADILCDDMYASSKFDSDPALTEEEYFAHVLYACMGGVNAQAKGLMKNEMMAKACDRDR